MEVVAENVIEIQSSINDSVKRKVKKRKKTKKKKTKETDSNIETQCSKIENNNSSVLDSSELGATGGAYDNGAFVLDLEHDCDIEIENQENIEKEEIIESKNKLKRTNLEKIYDEPYNSPKHKRINFDIIDETLEQGVKNSENETSFINDDAISQTGTRQKEKKCDTIAFKNEIENNLPVVEVSENLLNEKISDSEGTIYNDVSKPSSEIGEVEENVDDKIEETNDENNNSSQTSSIEEVDSNIESSDVDDLTLTENHTQELTESNLTILPTNLFSPIDSEIPSPTETRELPPVSCSYTYNTERPTILSMSQISNSTTKCECSWRKRDLGLVPPCYLCSSSDLPPPYIKNKDRWKPFSFFKKQQSPMIFTESDLQSRPTLISPVRAMIEESSIDHLISELEGTASSRQQEVTQTRSNRSISRQTTLNSETGGPSRSQEVSVTFDPIQSAWVPSFIPRNRETSVQDTEIGLAQRFGYEEERYPMYTCSLCGNNT